MRLRVPATGVLLLLVAVGTVSASYEVEAGPVHVLVETSAPGLVAVEHADQGTLDPRDDEVVLYQDVEHILIGVDVPGVAQEFTVDFRDPVLDHDLFARADAVLALYRKGAPPLLVERASMRFGSDCMWPQFDPRLPEHPLTPELALNPDACLSYTDDWGDMGPLNNTLTYDKLYLRPWAVNGTESLHAAVRHAWELCWLGPYYEQYTGEHRCLTREAPGPLWDALKSSLPSAEVRFRILRLEAALGPQPAMIHARHAQHFPGLPHPAEASPGAPAITGSALEASDAQASLPREPVPLVSPMQDVSSWATSGVGPSPIAPGDWPLVIVAILAVAIGPLAWLLYHRLQRSELLNHDRRAAILEQVARIPGITEQELARRLDMRHSLVDYHTRQLVNHGLLSIRRIGRSKCFFAAAAENPSSRLRPLLDRGRTREVLLAIARQPGATLSAVSAAASMTPSSAHWHVQRLTMLGLVEAEREGREVHLRVAEQRKALVLDVLAAARPEHAAPLASA